MGAPVLPPPAATAAASKQQRDEPDAFQPAPEFGTAGWAAAGLLSRVTFSFVAPLLRLGTQQELTEETADAYFPRDDTAEVQGAAFGAAFAAVQREAAAAHGAAPPPAALLWRAWRRLFGRTAALHCFWATLECVLVVGQAVIMRQLLIYLNDFETNPAAAPPSWHGWMWAALLACCGYAYTLLHHQLFWVGQRMGLATRQQAIAAVQAKVLRLNGLAVADETVGKIINLISNDVRRCDEAANTWPWLVLAPLQLAAIFVLIGEALGYPASLAGCATLLLLIPTQALLARRITRLRAAAAAATDARVRLTSEALNGVLAAKMLVWEAPLLRALGALRAAEAAPLRRMARIRAANQALSWAVAPLSALGVFGVARAVGDELSVPTVFYAIALLSIPKLYLADFFVLAVQSAAELRVSVSRIAAFLTLPEPPAPSWQRQPGAPGGGGAAGAAAEEAVPSQGDGQLPAIEVNGADFDWADRSWVAAAGGQQQQQQQASPSGEAAGEAAPPTQPTLPGLRLAVRRGELLAVVGAVGSGKTSLLAALLGELPPVQQPAAAAGGSGGSSAAAAAGGAGAGAVVVRGSVAYCAQVPWIEAGTVRENVLFGRRWEDARYTGVLAACALQHDINELPAGDVTEIGERGVTLSGGQKARLALARAAYSGADILLLDDPLSAVDTRVGRTLFDACLGPRGLLAGTTRVLVTHQRQYLPACDRVLVMRGGRLVAQGTAAQLAQQGYPEVAAGAAEAAMLDDSLYAEHAEHAEHAERSRSWRGAAAGRRSSAGSGEIEAARRRSQQLGPQLSTRRQSGFGRSVSNSFEVVGGADVSEAYAAWGVQSDTAADSSDDEATRRRSKHLGPQLSSRRPSGFDRVVSQVFEITLEGIPAAEEGASDATATADGTAQQSSHAGVPARAAQRQRLPGWLRCCGAPQAGAAAAGDSGEAADAAAAAAAGAGHLLIAEDRAQGSISASVYAQYARYMGVWAVALVAVALVGGQAALLYSQYWLAMWADQDPEQQQELKWVWVYAIFAGCLLVLSLVRAALFFKHALAGATALHADMAAAVLRAPLSFFHTNPAGRILNRFSKDQGAVDEQLPAVLFDGLQAFMSVLGGVLLLIIVAPYIAPLFVPAAVALWWLHRRYSATSREVKRFDATTRSPVVAMFSALLKGLPTIRAFGASARFRAAFLAALSRNGAWWFTYMTCARWIGFRLDLLVALLMTAAPLLLMGIRSSLPSPRLVGLALAQALQLGRTLQWMARQGVETENYFTSVERMLAYTQLPQEPPTQAQGGAAPPPGWPRDSGLQYRGVTAVYRPGLPPVLRGLTFALSPGCTAGVVGRTGSGKSSLMLTLFRLIPLQAGHILLGGTDIATLALDVLRSQLAIIPQDPVLFSGTLRSNLDPWGACDDARLWEALAAVQLRGAAAAAGGLDAPMAEAGDNLSVGQRQLLCLARALLADCAVLALDEATASVDRQTDALIQGAVRAWAAGGGRSRTLLVIAHRIDTILDCDQLLVLSAGQLAEFGPPAQLARSGGIFSRLVGAARGAG